MKTISTCTGDVNTKMSSQTLTLAVYVCICIFALIFISLCLHLALFYICSFNDVRACFVFSMQLSGQCMPGLVRARMNTQFYITYVLHVCTVACITSVPRKGKSEQAIKTLKVLLIGKLPDFKVSAGQSGSSDLTSSLVSNPASRDLMKFLF